MLEQGACRGLERENPLTNLWFPLATSTLHYFIIRGWQGRLQIYPGRDHREQMSKEEMKRSPLMDISGYTAL